MIRKHTEEFVKNCLLKFNFKLVSDFPEFISKAKITIQCLNCQSLKTIRLHSCNSLKCRKCNPNSKYTRNNIIMLCNNINWEVISICGSDKNLSHAVTIISCRKCNFKKTVIYFPDLLRKPNCINCNKILLSKTDQFNEKTKTSNFKILSEYINLEHPVTLECLVCHTIINFARARHFFKNGICRNCHKSDRLSLKFVKESIEKIGNFIYLDDHYTKAKEEHRILCLDCNQEFSSSYMRLVLKGRGCTKCKLINQNENLVFNCLKLLIKNETFKRQHKIYTNGDILQKHILVDFYCENQNLIIEYNGDQHYKPINFGSQSLAQSENSFKRQIIRDEWLRKYCNINDIRLVEIDGRSIYGRRIHQFILSSVIPLIS